MAVEKTQGLERLEIRAINTAREDHFLFAVLSNPGILKARLPYPPQYQWLVDEAMELEPQRDIRNKRDAIRLKETCDSTLALIKARTKTQ